MKELNLKLLGDVQMGETMVLIDGKSAKFKRNEFKNLVCHYETPNDSVKIEIYKAMDVGGVFWFLAQLFFFVISIFGIFDVYSKGRAVCFEYKAVVNLSEGKNDISLRYRNVKQDGEAFVADGGDLNVELNRRFVDPKAKKKLKILNISKVLLAIAIVAVAIAVVAVKVIGV